MSIIAVNEVQEGTDSIVSRFTRGMTRIFLVETDDATTAKLLAESDSRIPSINDFYQFEEGTGGTFIVDQTRIVDAIATEAVAGKPTWVRVRIEYIETPLNFGFGWTDPTLDTPIISVQTQETEEPIYFDLGGEPIVNSAGVTFDPPISETRHDMIVQVNVNQPITTLQTFMRHVNRYNGMTNSATWLGILEGQGLMRVSGQQATRGGISFWATVYQIVVRRDGWRRKIIDEGYQQIRTTGAAGLEPILDLEGRAITEPRLLDGAGLAVTVSSKGKILEFITKEKIDFNPLFARFSGGSL